MASCLSAALVLLLGSCGPGAPTPVEIPAGTASDPAVVALFERLEAAAKADPGNARAHLSLGLALEANDAFELAGAAYRNVLELEPSHSEALYRVAALKGRLGDFEAQRAQLRAVLEVNDAHHAARYDLALALLDDGQLDEAEAQFAVLDDRVEELGLPDLGLGLVDLERDDAQAAVPHLEAAFEKHPGDAFIRFKLAEALRLSGAKDRAAAVTTGIAKATGRPTLNSGFAAEKKSYEVSRQARLERATDLISEGKGADALQPLQELRASHPDDFDVVTNYAAALLQVGRATEALPFIEDAIAQRPGHEVPHKQRARALLLTAASASDPAEAQRRRSEALESANAAIELRPEQPQGYIERARALVALQRDAESLSAFRRAVELGDNAESVFIEMLEPAARFGGDPALEEILREGIAQGPGRIKLQFSRCGVLLRLGRPEDARAQQREMAAAAPNHGLTQRAGQLLRQLGN